MKTTTNLGLKKPDYTDAADIAVINENMDKLDAAVEEKADLEHTHTKFDNDVQIANGKALTAQTIKGNTGLSIEADTTIKGKLDVEGRSFFKADTITKRLYPESGGTHDIGTNAMRYNVGYFKKINAEELEGLSLTDIDGNEVRLVNKSAQSEGYFFLVNWRYTGYDRFVIGYHPYSEDETAVHFFEYINTNGYLNSLVGFRVGGKNVLTEDSIIPLSKGGTGATTAAGARTALGLGTAATKGVSASVSASSDNLVTSAAVYAALKALNINNRTHIVIAAHDTKNPLKANADYTCTSTNASEVIKQAIDAIGQGGKIELLDGTYNLDYEDDQIVINKAGITIEGAGYHTVVKQPIDSYYGEAKFVFKITAQNVSIKKMMICDAVVTSPVSMIYQEADGASYEEIFFIYNASESTCENACIEGAKTCNYTRIQNCRVYKGFNVGTKAMFDFASCTGFCGVIGANISSGYNDITIRFANETHKNNTALYGHAGITIKIGRDD